MTLKEKEIESIKDKSYNYYNCRDVKKAVNDFEKKIIAENKFTKGKIFKIHKEVFGDFTNI